MNGKKLVETVEAAADEASEQEEELRYRLAGFTNSSLAAQGLADSVDRLSKAVQALRSAAELLDAVRKDGGLPA